MAGLLGVVLFLAMRMQRRIDTLSGALKTAQQRLLETQAQGDTLQRAEAAEAERHNLVERLTMAMSAAGISMWDWDIHTDHCTVMEGSPFTERLGGRTTYKGVEYPKLVVHPEDRSAWRKAFIDGISQPPGQDLFSHRYRAIYPNGSLHWIQFHCRVLRNAHGKPHAVLGVDWDATNEVNAAAEIAAQAQKIVAADARLQRAVGGTQDALFDIDIVNQSHWMAPRFFEMLGYAADEPAWTNEGFTELVHPDDQPRRQLALQAHLESSAPFDLEYRLRKKNGEWLWIRARATAERDANGRAMRLSGSVQDNTEARAARETLIRATQTAEEASRSKSAFLATMSHEIRTPMNGIMGMTTLLLDSPLDNVQRDYAQTVLSSADSLLTILNDILDFSKIEAGKLEIEAIEMDLAATVEDIGALMAFQCAAKNLELIVNIRPDVPEWIIGDPQRIRQCLLNLVGNAIKFTQKGEVFIDVFTVGRRDGQFLVQFEVRDTGLGIETDVLKNLFQPFTQADSSTTRRFGGTGLGLSIVRRLVQLMGGEAGAQSEAGKGSLFWFTLPLAPSDTAKANAKRNSHTATHRVLLVDDNETNRRVLTGQLLHAGYEVESAASGARALAIMRERVLLPFDLVLLDFEMPDMDGATLGEAIMADLELSRTRLIMLTSLDRSGDMQRFAEIGFAAYLAKPIRGRELLRCLRKALGYDIEVWQERSQPMITRGGLFSSDADVYSGKVLIVEDNVINQRVAARFLERLGCQVEISDDGAKAVDAFDHNVYSLILMDMQMPVMDGLEATRRIRAIEKRKQSVRTPIVALTANAMTGQMELCLEAGMDDYLAKPLDIDRLHGILDRYIKVGSNLAIPVVATDKLGASTAPHSTEPDVQDAQMLARLKDISDGDDTFANELTTVFLDSGYAILDEMRAAIASNDLLTLGRAAHKLKGASNNLHMLTLGTLAQSIELNATASAQRDWQRELNETLQEFERIRNVLKGANDRSETNFGGIDLNAGTGSKRAVG